MEGSVLKCKHEVKSAKSELCSASYLFVKKLLYWWIKMRIHSHYEGFVMACLYKCKIGQIFITQILKEAISLPVIIYENCHLDLLMLIGKYFRHLKINICSTYH